MTKPTRQPRPPTVLAPPAAALRVEPTGAPGSARQYLMTLDLEVRAPAETAVADALVLSRTIAVDALKSVAASSSAVDQPTLRDTKAAAPRDGSPAPDVVTGVVAAVLCDAWPDSATMDTVRAELIHHGYQVTTSERRACAEPRCTADTVIEPGHRNDQSQDWFNMEICGRHNYRTCTSCTSVLRMTSSSAAGPAPAVSCPICQARLVEWGGSKLWEVELVTRPAP